MLVEPRELQSNKDIETDVCIVGAGPAGITLALEFINAGFRVCLLESGGKERAKAFGALNDGTSVGYPYFPLAETRGRAFGGTSSVWDLDKDGWRWLGRPLDALDFEARDGIPHTGWPFRLSHLLPFYERAQTVCRLGPFVYDVEAWEDKATSPRLPLPARSGVVTTIFQYGSTNFVDYFDDLVKADAIRLCLHATVTEIVTDRTAQAVSCIRGVGKGGTQFSVRARQYVLAMGAIENARLLLLSTGTHKRGLGNDNDLVGRFFMERLTVRSGVLVPTDRTLVSRARLYSIHRANGRHIQGAIGLTEDMLRARGLLRGIFFVVPTHRPFMCEGVRSLITLRRSLQRRPRPGAVLGHMRNVITDVDDLARTVYLVALRRKSAEHDVFYLRTQAEQSPNPDSRVTLDDQRDALGLPKARLDWRLSDRDLRSIRETQDCIDGVFRQANLGRIELKLGDEHPPALFRGNHHHMGTTRMHTDPRQGVVDADCRVHGVQNLFIAGSSVFPTAGYANPTLTIVALAARLADHIRSRFCAR